MTIFSDILDQELSLILELNNKLSNEDDGHIKGTALEVRLNSLLSRFLPSNINIARGWIIDSMGNRTAERDCLIYDTNKAPAFLFDGGTGIIPLISILYDIQIKSKLTEKTIRQAFEKFDNRINNNALIGNKGNNILDIYEKIDPKFYENPKIKILLSEDSGYYFFNVEEKYFKEIFDFENSIKINDKSFKITPNSDKSKININGFNLEELGNKKIKICRWGEFELIDMSKLKGFFIGLSNTLYRSTEIGSYLCKTNSAIRFHSIVIFDQDNNIISKKKIGEKNADIENINNLHLSIGQDGILKLTIDF